MRQALIAGEGVLPCAIAEKLHDSGIELLILTLLDDVEALRPYASKIIRMKTPGISRVVRE
ncbi:MAG: hypothetical protein IJL01_06305, partial [Synergistaceae bacterium]|nr:hypothetical protein [Synergistaceae bacterium]